MLLGDIGNETSFILNLDESRFVELVDPMLCLNINMGSGQETSIHESALKVASIIGYEGRLLFDHSKPDGTQRKLLDSPRLHELG